MNKLENIVAYLCRYYPHNRELSKARLTKLVYLSDWFSSLIFRRQLTNIEWVFNHYGPYVDDVVRVAQYSPYFRIVNTITHFGTEKSIIYYLGTEEDILLTEDEIKILNFVIDRTRNLYFDEFIDYVYSTYPIASKERYAYLNLVELANEYIHNNNR